MASYPRVALIVETAKGYDRGLLRGISRYIRGHGPWSVYLEERGPQDGAPTWLKTWSGDGVIARIKDLPMAEALVNLKIPVVELRRQVEGFDLPSVHCNDRAICELAFEHFRERGFRQFGFCGRADARWSDLREAEFRDLLLDFGQEYHAFDHSVRGRPRTWEQEQDRIARWLKSLPRPIAILACNDIRGMQVLDACRRIDLAVPEGVAVMGVDNDVTLCELADPSLSSIDQDLERIGYEAASLLGRLMDGEFPEAMSTLIEPIGVACRQSTDSSAIDDPAVATAMRLIRLNAGERKGIDDLVDRVGLSRRMLQRRFKAATGRTLQDEIQDVQLDRVRHMLTETDLKLEVIAKRNGFTNAGYLCFFFKKLTGMTPGEYRATASKTRHPPRL